MIKEPFVNKHVNMKIEKKKSSSGMRQGIREGSRDYFYVNSHIQLALNSCETDLSEKWLIDWTVVKDVQYVVWLSKG